MVSTSSRLPRGEEIDERGIESWLRHVADKRSLKDIEYLRDACLETLRLHGQEQEVTGELKVLHLLSVAEILEGLELDRQTIAAAVLHDAASHKDFDTQWAGTRFGTGVVEMIRSMARIHLVTTTGLTERESAEQHIENLRRMLLGIAEDVRVVLIVLAERLHVMRVMKTLPRESQISIAQETQDIYAPLANRLGIWQIKWELEDLCLRYIDPDIYKRIASRLDGRRRDREKYIGEVTRFLNERLGELGMNAEVSGRPKHIYSIWKKMIRKSVDFDQIFDVLAVRVLVDTIAECYETLGVVHGQWRHIPGEFDDYIATPKVNGYRSLHTAVIGPEGKPMEVQIRTRDMHQHAERGVAAHWLYKEDRDQDPDLARRIRWMRRWLETKDDGETSEAFIESVKSDFEPAQVYVLTPQGKVVELPQGATPVDFAYAVHTSVGHRCRGAKVDGRIVQLNHKLESGETVEILTGKHEGPSRDWLSPHLGYLKTSRARNRVRHWFKLQDYDHHVAIGRASLEREMTRLGVTEKPDLEAIATRFNFQKSEDILAAIGRGELSPIQVAGTPEQQRPPSRRPRVVTDKHKREPQAQVAVEGVDDLMTHLAKCCKPVPYDPIVGFITRGFGVSVHRRDCSNIVNLDAEDKERLVKVNWSEQYSDASYAVDLFIKASDRKGLLRDITSVLANEEIDVIGVNTSTQRKTDTATMSFTVEISDIMQLSRVIDKLAQLPEVIEVHRLV